MTRRKVGVAVLLAGGAVLAGLVAGRASAGSLSLPTAPLAAPRHAAVPALTSTLTTVTRTFSTQTNAINAGQCGTPFGDNQGWWSATADVTIPNSDCNSNYFTGSSTTFGIAPHASYFMFDLSNWTNACPIQSASLTLWDAGAGNQYLLGSGPDFLSFGLFDVSTDPFTLSEKDNNPSATIENDLNTGTMYGGPYTIDTFTFFSTYTLTLKQAGLNALLAARRNHQQYFAFGGGLINPSAGDDFLFGDTGGNDITLSVTQPKLCRIS